MTVQDLIEQLQAQDVDPLAQVHLEVFVNDLQSNYGHAQTVVQTGYGPGGQTAGTRAALLITNKGINQSVKTIPEMVEEIHR